MCDTFPSRDGLWPHDSWFDDELLLDAAFRSNGSAVANYRYDALPGPHIPDVLDRPDPPLGEGIFDFADHTTAATFYGRGASALLAAPLVGCDPWR